MSTKIERELVYDKVEEILDHLTIIHKEAGDNDTIKTHVYDINMCLSLILEAINHDKVGFKF